MYVVARACKRCLTGRLVRLRFGLASKQRHSACTVIHVLEMESIRVIQEVVDAHKEQMPTGVVTTVMEECQKLYDAKSNLYKLTWTVVDSHAHIEHIEDEEDIANVKLSHATQTLIVEAVNNLPDHPDHGPRHKMNVPDMPNHGMMLKSWLKSSKPFVLMRGEDCMTIIHSIEPYHKRAREEA